MFNNANNQNWLSSPFRSPHPGLSSHFEHTPMSSGREPKLDDTDNRGTEPFRKTTEKQFEVGTILSGISGTPQASRLRITSPQVTSQSEPRRPIDDLCSPNNWQAHRRNATFHSAVASGIKRHSENAPEHIPAIDTGWDEVQSTEKKARCLHRQDMLARKTREFYMGLIGVQIVFMYSNFVFLNFSGAVISLFGCFGAIYAHCDRRLSTYILSCLLQGLVGLVVAVGVSTNLSGFSAYRENSHLKAISVAHVPASFFLGLMAAFLARFEYVKPSNKVSDLPRSPSRSALVEDDDDNALVVRVTAPTFEPSSFVHTPSSPYGGPTDQAASHFGNPPTPSAAKNEL